MKNGEIPPTLKSKATPKVEPKPLHFKVSELIPADIIDSWKLFEMSQKLFPQNYPVLEEEQPSFVRAHILKAMVSENFFGVIARAGRKPIGQITGMVQVRPYGTPRVFFQFWLFFVDPAYRKASVGWSLFSELSKILKSKGIHNFESVIDPVMIPVMEKVYGGPLQVVSHRIIGKLKVD